MSSGTVKWFNEKKGFGFIAPEGEGRDVFVHHSVIEGTGFKTLVENEPVEFELDPVDDSKGPRASKVVRLAPPARAPRPAPAARRAPAVDSRPQVQAQVPAEVTQRGSLGTFLAEAMGKKVDRTQLRGGLD